MTISPRLAAFAIAIAIALAIASTPNLACSATDPTAAESTAADDPGCAVMDDIAGVWITEDGSSAVRFFEQDSRPTYVQVADGRLQTAAPIVTCGEGLVETCSFGRRTRFELARVDETLTVSTERSTETYQRSRSLPEAFEPQPLDLPAAMELPAERVEVIRTELARRYELDQGVRQEPIDDREMRRVDVDNTAYLKELIDEVGWIDAERFGPAAAETAFLIVQHSGDLPLLATALPRLREAGHLESYALMFDRFELNLGRPQRYGSQVGWTEDGEKGLLPIETLDGIDELRATMSLGPLDDYLAYFEIEGRPVLDCR